MATTTIQNPATKRNINVRVFDVENRVVSDALLAAHKDGKTMSAKDISWMLLNQQHSVAAMERTEGGDSAANNFALNVLENALDWSLGIAVLNFRKDARAVWGRVPRTYKVAAARNGDIFVGYESAGKTAWVKYG